MATTISVSSFQAACAECADAIIAHDWAAADNKYAVATVINGGLELEVEAQGTRMQRRETLADMKVAIDAAEVSASRRASCGRFVTTQTRHT